MESKTRQIYNAWCENQTIRDLKKFISYAITLQSHDEEDIEILHEFLKKFTIEKNPVHSANNSDKIEIFDGINKIIGIICEDDADCLREELINKYAQILIANKDDKSAVRFIETIDVNNLDIDIQKELLDLALMTGNDTLGGIITDSLMELGISYDEVDFKYVPFIDDFDADAIYSGNVYFAIYRELENTPYEKILFNLLINSQIDFKTTKLNYPEGFEEWLCDNLNTSIQDNQEYTVLTVIEIALRNFNFNRNSAFNKAFTKTILEQVVAVNKYEFLRYYIYLLENTNQLPFVTKENLIFLKAEIERGNDNALKIAETILSKKSFKEFTRISSTYLQNNYRSISSQRKPRGIKGLTYNLYKSLKVKNKGQFIPEVKNSQLKKIKDKNQNGIGCYLVLGIIGLLLLGVIIWAIIYFFKNPIVFLVIVGFIILAIVITIIQEKAANLFKK